MKFKIKIVLLVNVLLISTFIFISAAKHKSENEQVKKVYLSYIDQIIQSLGQLNPNSIELKQDYLDLRQQFKTIEFLLAHIDQQFYLKHLNGAPLSKLEQKVPDINVIAPEGFQVLDELIFSGEEELNTPSIKIITDKLKTSFVKFKKHHQYQSISNTLLLEAVQYELIRLYSQGLTGFDTPASLNGILDGKNTLSGIQMFLKKSDLEVSNQIINSIKQSIIFLDQNNNFAKFDRLEFYKEYWKPLYTLLINELGVHKMQYVGQPREVNLKALGLFEDDFLNKEAFLDIPKNYLNKEMISLGKELFFSPVLSNNNSMSCASCHSPEHAFSDAKKFSVTASDNEVVRNSPGLWNSIYTKSFFYDLRASKLSEQFEHVIFNEKEFNTTINEILAKLNQDPQFYAKFKAQFPQHKNNPINVYTFKSALSTYVSSLTGFNTEFDSYMVGSSNAIDEEVKNGFNLFMGKAACATCHFPPTFSGLLPPYYNDSESEVLGVPSDTSLTQIDKDLGRYSNKKPKEHHHLYQHSFKTTTVRTASNTAPYMHNGVFDSLPQVLDFYNNGGGVGHGLEVPNQTLSSDSLGLDSVELKALERFIKSLEFKTSEKM